MNLSIEKVSYTNSNFNNKIMYQIRANTFYNLVKLEKMKNIIKT